MNVILIIADSLRADHLGCYGNSWISTPALDALAAESVRFSRACPEALPTIPARRAIHTGLRTFPFDNWVPEKGASAHRYGWQRIPEDQVTLAEILSHAGYHTAFITDCYHYFKPTMNFHRGFSQWEWIRGQERDPYRSIYKGDRARAKALAPVPDAAGPQSMLLQYLANAARRQIEEDWQAPLVFQAAMRWIAENQGISPFFLLIDSFDPHEPWDPPQPYVDLYDPGYQGRTVITPRYGPSDYLSKDELRHMRALYAAEVTMVDHWLGRFLNWTQAHGMLEDTLVIVMSDHGHQLGEHGLTGKVASGLYAELTDVPLLLRHPRGERAGQVCTAFAQDHDLAPTVLGLLGIKPPLPMEGQDLWQVVEGAVPPRSYITAGMDDYVWCRNDDYVYMSRNDGSDARLFDARQDPAQQRDVAAHHPEVMRDMFARVLADAGGVLPDYRHLQERTALAWWELYRFR
ncbi:MAG: sulfatase [Chloroflexi bacterium]|nr:sulfatase [Chloroflexota bacterium]